MRTKRRAREGPPSRDRAHDAQPGIAAPPPVQVEEHALAHARGGRRAALRVEELGGAGGGVDRERHLERRVPALDRDARVDAVVRARRDGPVRGLEVPGDEDEIALVGVPVGCLAREAVPGLDVARDIGRDDGVPTEPLSCGGKRRATVA